MTVSSAQTLIVFLFRKRYRAIDTVLFCFLVVVFNDGWHNIPDYSSEKDTDEWNRSINKRFGKIYRKAANEQR